MSFSEEFQADIEALPNILQRKYSQLRDMDKSLQEIQRQNEQRCEQEIDDMKRAIKSHNITPNSSLLKFSDEAMEEQKHALRIADEKVSLAQKAYDLVDEHIQHLDQYLKKLDEDLRREREVVAGPPTLDKNVKSGKSDETTSHRGRKKRLAATAGTAASASASASTSTTAAAASAAVAANSTSMELDLPIDPNEPTYCFCNQVSYGEMVACDNDDCKIEWFHLGCVGLKDPPKGKWYCSECAGTQKRRKKR